MNFVHDRDLLRVGTLRHCSLWTKLMACPLETGNYNLISLGWLFSFWAIRLTINGLSTLTQLKRRYGWDHCSYQAHACAHYLHMQWPLLPKSAFSCKLLPRCSIHKACPHVLSSLFFFCLLGNILVDRPTLQQVQGRISQILELEGITFDAATLSRIIGNFSIPTTKLSLELTGNWMQNQ